MLPPLADAGPFAGPLVVTLLYVTLYYGTIFRISRTKPRLMREYRERGEKFDRYFSQDREMLAADRAQLNLLEHMPIFVCLLWLHAVFVSPTTATWGGAVYVAARVVHPFLIGSRLGREVRQSILLATIPGYLALAFLMVGIVIVVVTH